jgi:DNA-binding NtrC family response regulator
LPVDVIEGLFGLEACPGIELPDFLESALDAALAQSGADAGGAIFVTDGRGERLHWSVRALLGTPRQSRNALVRDWARHAVKSPVQWMPRDLLTVRPATPNEAGAFALFEDSRSVAWAPIEGLGSKLGRLQVEAREGAAFSREELQGLEELARLTGLLARRLLLRDHAAANGHDVHMVGMSPRFLELERELELLAADPQSPVLLCGERGTGKELAAYAVHCFSSRRDGPFIAVNSASFAPELIADALFGHARGAFTGAGEVRGGIFTEAESGTLFFDEVGDMPLHVQAALLRVLDQGEVRPVGADRPHHVDVRIVAATNRDLDAMMEQGAFRRDLFDRLNVFRVMVPPLCERPEDLRLLADFFLRKACSENDRSRRMGDRNACRSCLERAGRVCTDPDFYEVLARCELPGNVRELRNLLFRLAAMVREELRPSHLAAFQGNGRRKATQESEEEPLRLDSMLRLHIGRVLEMADGNKSEAARLLGLPLSTLYNKMKRLGMA